MYLTLYAFLSRSLTLFNLSIPQREIKMAVVQRIYNLYFSVVLLQPVTAKF